MTNWVIFMSKTKKPKRLPIYKVRYPNGQVAYQVDKGWLNGKRQRKNFKTREEAVIAAEQLHLERQNEGLKVYALPQDTKLDAAKAHEVLAPYGITLFEAAEHYKNHVLAYKDAPSVHEVVSRMIAEKTAMRRSQRTVLDLKNRLEAFAEDFGDRRLSDIAKDEIKEWLTDEEWAPRTRINYQTKLSQLFNFALDEEWVDKNIVERISRPLVTDTTPEIFTLDESERLLKNANQFGLLPYIAIGLFAGLRSAELKRIQGEDIRIEESSILVGASIAKKRARRIVKMHDALISWLQPCLPLRGHIVDVSQFRKNMEKLRVAAQIEKWRLNGLRHSCASYHYAAFENENLTAKHLGHRNADVLHNHYKALVSKADALKFWNLRPDTASSAPQTPTKPTGEENQSGVESGNIVQMPVAA